MTEDPRERTTVTITCRDFKEVEHCEDCHGYYEGGPYQMLTCTRPLATFDVSCTYCCLSLCSLLPDDRWVEALHETLLFTKISDECRDWIDQQIRKDKEDGPRNS